VAVIDVDELTVKLVAGTPPKETLVAPVKFVPVMLTLVPPVAVPLVVPRLVTVGAEAAVTVKVDDADVPLGVITVTPTEPAFTAGSATCAAKGT
jgi:hypothetical protein